MSFRVLFLEKAAVNLVVQIAGYADCNSIYVALARLAIARLR